MGTTTRTERGKGKLVVGSDEEPVDAYYQLAWHVGEDGFRVVGKIATESQAWPNIQERPRSRLMLGNGDYFDFAVQELLLERGVAGAAFTRQQDLGLVVASVVGTVSSPSPPKLTTYFALEDLLQAEMPWLGEAGSRRIESAALRARVEFRVGARAGNLPPAGEKGSEILPCKVHEGVYNAVATEFRENGRLTPAHCASSIPQITFQILRITDRPVWGPYPYTISLTFMGVAVDEWRARCLEQQDDLDQNAEQLMDEYAVTVRNAWELGISKTKIAVRAGGFSRRTVDRLLNRDGAIALHTAKELATAAKQLLRDKSAKK